MCFTAAYIDEYKSTLIGLDDSRSTLKNVQSNISRVKAFVNYMGYLNTRLFDWTFLNNPKRIRT